MRIKPQTNIEKFELALESLEKYKTILYSGKGIFGREDKGWRIVKLFKPIREEIVAYGHPNIKATHETTLEITKEDFLTERGDCIIGIKANKACKDLSEEFKIAIKSGCKVRVKIVVDELEDEFYAFGSPALKLKDEKSIVIRKSDFIDERTLLILSEKSAKDIKREIVEKLKDPKKVIRIIFEIEEKYF